MDGRNIFVAIILTLTLVAGINNALEKEHAQKMELNNKIATDLVLHNQK